MKTLASPVRSKGAIGVCLAAWVLSACASHAAQESRLQAITAPLPPPRVLAGELDARALLGELAARAARLGAGAPSVVASGEAIDNSWIGGFVQVPQDVCVLGYARGSSSVDDVDAAIYAEDGTTLAVDEGRDVHPTVLLCAPHPERVYIAAHVVEGEGLVAVGAQLVPRDRAVIVARALGARGLAGQSPRPAESWPGLDDAVRTNRAEIGGNWQEFRRVALSIDSRMPTYVALPIEADTCVNAIIVPDEDVALLDVEAVDDHGRVVARAREGGGPRMLTVCSPLQIPGTLSIRPHVGRGLAAVVLAHASRDTSRDLAVLPEIVWVAPTEPLEKAKSERSALLAKSGYDAAVATTSGTLTIGRRVSLPLDLKPLAGSCGRIDVVAGAPLALVDAQIWSDAGALLASGDAAASMALFACARTPAHIELETRGRAGPFAVMVRPERWKDSVFEAHPLAASRMLARAAQGPNALFDGKELAVKELILDGDRRTSWSEVVPAGDCLRATVGAQGEGAGIEVRVFEGTDEIDRSEAAHAASVTACATPDGPRTVRVEARASAGRVEAVVGERISNKD